jgi:hypothetical protein
VRGHDIVAAIFIHDDAPQALLDCQHRYGGFVQLRGGRLALER